MGIITVEEGLPLFVMSCGTYSKFKQLWPEGKIFRYGNKSRM